MAVPADAGPPTIQLHARIRADSIRVERQGEAHLTVAADPVLAQAVDVRRSKPVPNGQTVKNVVIDLDARATVDPDGGPPAVSIRAATPGEPSP